MRKILTRAQGDFQAVRKQVICEEIFLSHSVRNVRFGAFSSGDACIWKVRQDFNNNTNVSPSKCITNIHVAGAVRMCIHCDCGESQLIKHI